MIVKMKKASIVMLDQYKTESLNGLKKIGVLHIQSKNSVSEELSSLKDQKNRMEKAYYLIPSDGKVKTAESITMDEAFKIQDAILSLTDETRVVRDEIDKLNREEAFLIPWGNFDPKDITDMRNSDISVKLFSLSPEDFKNLEDYPFRFVALKTKNQVLFAEVFIAGSEPVHKVEEIPLPERSLEEIQASIQDKKDRLIEIEEELKTFHEKIGILHKGISILDEKLEFEQVKSDMGEEDEDLCYVSGFVPVTKIDLLKKTAAKNGWALLIQDPEEEDTVPTLVQYAKPIRMVKPIFRLLDTIPGYHEYDISFWFLLFFALFFAMIIGDAGYGAIFFIASIVLGIKRRKFTPGVTLLFVLSICTLVWGAITGTWFGSEKIAEMKPFSSVIIHPIASTNPMSGDTVKWLCFIIGTVQISIAHIQNFIKRMPSLKAFSQLGWLSMVLGLFYLVLNLVIDAKKYPLPDYAFYMILVGFIMVFLFGNQEKGVNFFKGILKGLGGLLTNFLDGIGAFSDIISYIRLFAVGLATVAIAQSFNAMAGNLAGGVVGTIGAAFILAFGHGLNLIMAMLSVVVHGIRLNMLEFSGHLGMEWSGIKYEPFRTKGNLH